ncbi:MAG: tetratricopeptide repeat protein [Planctomycetota bacterium]|nr:tetratricopeptide repeat protein [Planctomycetota bacterium]
MIDASSNNAIQARHPGRRRLVLLTVLLAIALAVPAAFYVLPNPARDFEVARAALQTGDLQRVQRALERLDHVPGYAPHCSYLRGALLLRGGSAKEALTELGMAIQQPELQTDALVLSGQALYQMGRVAEARGLWQQVLTMNPASVKAHRWLGIMYYDIGAMEDALRHLGQVSELAPDDARPDRLMGLIHKDYNKYPEAIEHYQESIRRDPNPPDRDDILLELAEAQAGLLKYADALLTLQQCRESTARKALEANCHYGLGDTASTLEIVGEGLKQSPDDLSLLLLQGKSLLFDKAVDQAIDVLSHAAEKHPMDSNVQYLLSQAYAQIGNEAKALEHAASASRLKEFMENFSDLNARAITEPSNADLRFKIGQMALQLGWPELADSWFHAALAINPTHAQAASALKRDP